MPRKPKRVMGQPVIDGKTCCAVLLPMIGVRIKSQVTPLGAAWTVIDYSGKHVASGVAKGKTEAAGFSAAKRWLVKRAQLTMKLAGER